MSSEDSIHISSIALEVQQKCNKTMHHIMLQTHAGRFKKEIPGQFYPGRKHREVFETPLELSAQDKLTVSMQYQTQCLGSERTRHITMVIKQSDIVKKAREDAHGNELYIKLKRNIMIIVNISYNSVHNEEAHNGEHGPSIAGVSEDSDSLLPTTSEILSVCPRFRLLIIGNTGVGKSTLIQNVFGVKDVDVSKSSRGKADIDQEFIAAGNEHFVLHDSLGLEAGEKDNLAKIKSFIRDRRQKQDLKERLHAVWVCLEVPHAKGRLLEAGMEGFLRDRKEILGNIPIVVVLTKLDKLDKKLMETMQTEGIKFKSIQEAQLPLELRRAKYLEKHCIKLLEQVAGNDVPHVAVSTTPGYYLEPTIPELVKKTISEIEQYIKADPLYGAMSEQLRINLNAPLYTAGMAQRVSVEKKVDLTIDIGKRRYWANLGASIASSAESVEKRLLVIHKDIIKVWNFNDPDMALQDEKFKTALLDTSNLGGCDISGSGGQDVLHSAGPMISILISLVNDPTLIVVALPVAGAVALASLCYQIYRSARSTAKRFMAYIADLIYVMKILFIFAPHGSITAQDVAHAFEIYTKSSYRNRVHTEINDFGAKTAMLPGGRDAVAEGIETLIRRYSITDEDVSRLRSLIPAPPAASQNASCS